VLKGLIKTTSAWLFGHRDELEAAAGNPAEHIPASVHVGDVLTVSGDRNHNSHVVQVGHTYDGGGRRRIHGDEGRVARVGAFLDALEEAYLHACAFREWDACVHMGLRPAAVAWPLRLLPLPRLSRLGSYRYACQLLVRSIVSPRHLVAK
jgi:hypothetical protein